MHSFLPFKHSRLRVYMPLFAALLLVLTPGMGAAAPAPASPVPEVSTATPSVVQEALQAVVEQTAPETPAAPVVQTASALPAVSGEPGSALAKEGASVPLQAEWLLDPKGTHTLTDVLSPNAQKEFKPYEPESLPHQAGTIWMRLEVEGKAPAFPLVLDLNTRIAGQLPGGGQARRLRQRVEAGIVPRSPPLFQHVAEEGMIAAHMIEYAVENDPDAERVRAADKIPEIVLGAHVRIDAIIIQRIVPVVRSRREDRVQVNAVEAQGGDVVEIFGHAAHRPAPAGRRAVGR